MFLSTVVTTAMLNVNQNLGEPDYKFSVPYNFVRGRNLIVSVTPAFNVYNTKREVTTIYVGTGTLVNRAGSNRLHIVVPDNVDVHTTNMDILFQQRQGETNCVLQYSVQVTFDTINNVITFKPTAYSIVSGTPINSWDGAWTAPVLININTIL